MNKKVIRLNEGQLKSVINNAIVRIVEENGGKVDWTEMPEWWRDEKKRMEDKMEKIENSRNREKNEEMDFMGVPGAKRFDYGNGEKEFYVTIPYQQTNDVYNIIEPEMRKLGFGMYSQEDDGDNVVFQFLKKEEDREVADETFVADDEDMSFLKDIVNEAIRKAVFGRL